MLQKKRKGKEITCKDLFKHVNSNKAFKEESFREPRTQDSMKNPSRILFLYQKSFNEKHLLEI